MKNRPSLFFLILLLAAAGAAGFMAYSKVLLALPAAIVALQMLPWKKRPRLAAALMGLLGACFFYAMGPGRFPDPSLGILGFAVVQGLLLLTLAIEWFLQTHKKRTPLSNSFTRITFPFVCVMVFGLAFISALGYWRSNGDWAVTGRALLQALSFFSLGWLGLFLSQQSRIEKSGRFLSLLLTGAMVAAFLLGAGRFALVNQHLEKAEQALKEGRNVEAEAALEKAQAENQWLKCIYCEEKAREIEAKQEKAP